MTDNKRAIVPNPSVGAGGEQPQSTKSNDIISDDITIGNRYKRSL